MEEQQMRFTIPQFIFLAIANPQKAFEEPAGDMSGALHSFSGKPDFHAAQKSAGKQRSIQNDYSIRFTSLSQYISCSFCNFSSQYLISIFCYPHKVIFYVIYCMAAASIFCHDFDTSCLQYITIHFCIKDGSSRTA